VEVKRPQSRLATLSRHALWAWTAAVLVLLYLPMLPPPIFSLATRASPTP